MRFRNFYSIYTLEKMEYNKWGYYLKEIFNMKKFLKLMLGIGGCLFYYIVVCILLDIDVFDPWEKVMKWAKGEKKE